MLCTATRASRSETGAAWHWTGWLLARAGYVSPCCNVMCLWYMCFCAEVFFFSVLRLYSKWSIVWGLKNFFSSSLSSCKKLYFLNTLSPVLSTPLSYVVYVWTGWWLISLVLVLVTIKGYYYYYYYYYKQCARAHTHTHTYTHAREHKHAHTRTHMESQMVQNSPGFHRHVIIKMAFS